MPLVLLWRLGAFYAQISDSASSLTVESEWCYQWRHMNDLIVTRADYDAFPGLNWSRLKLIERSPAHYLHGYNGESDALRLGTAAHMAILEPEKFAASYTVYTEGIRRGKKWEDFQEKAIAAGQSVLNQKEYDEAIRIRDAVKRHLPARRYLDQKGQAEVGLTWKLGDFQCKGRADWICDDAIVDIKTSADVSPRAFANSVARYGYHGQAAWYQDGVFKNTGKRFPYVIIAVESDAPHIVQVYRMPDLIVEQGRELYLTLLGKLDYCTKNKTWGGYSEEPELDMVLPDWKVKNEQ